MLLSLMSHCVTEDGRHEGISLCITQAGSEAAIVVRNTLTVYVAVARIFVDVAINPWGFTSDRSDQIRKGVFEVFPMLLTPFTEPKSTPCTRATCKFYAEHLLLDV